MKKKNKVDLLRIIADFQVELQNKPTHAEMVDEVRMMRFKIRPLAGDVSLLNFQDRKLIEILWNLGKLEEFFKKQKDQLRSEQQNVFFRYFDDLYDDFQEQLNRVNLRSEKEVDLPTTIEMEIYKDETRKKRLN